MEKDAESLLKSCVVQPQPSQLQSNDPVTPTPLSPSNLTLPSKTSAPSKTIVSNSVVSKELTRINRDIQNIMSDVRSLQKCMSTIPQPQIRHCHIYLRSKVQLQLVPSKSELEKTLNCLILDMRQVQATPYCAFKLKIREDSLLNALQSQSPYSYWIVRVWTNFPLKAHSTFSSSPHSYPPLSSNRMAGGEVRVGDKGDVRNPGGHRVTLSKLRINE